MAWHGEELPPPDSEQDFGSAQAAGKPGKGSPPATRFMKDRLEKDLFRRQRNLFNGLDLVFFDTASHYFHGAAADLLGRRGKSKDFRPQCPQLVVDLALSSDDRPLCTGIWPGNTAEVTTLLPGGETPAAAVRVRVNLPGGGSGHDQRGTHGRAGAPRRASASWCEGGPWCTWQTSCAVREPGRCRRSGWNRTGERERGLNRSKSTEPSAPAGRNVVPIRPLLDPEPFSYQLFPI